MRLKIGDALGHYDITAFIGEGGMGQVYRATDRLLKRDVALKVLPAETAANPERLGRFQREAQAVAALNHPNVVTIHSVEHAGDMHFLTMELVEGRTLVDIIPRGGLPLDSLLALAIPLTDAVSAAHARGIVHRDLKPANIMVGSDGRLKVLDFGLAKLRASAEPASPDRSTAMVTAPDRVFGTAAYMSPEQAEGKAAGAASDVFSLGIVLFEMATGARPFHGDSVAATISSILRDTPAEAGDLRSDLPADFSRIVRRCLAKDPAGRYGTALELRKDLIDLKEHGGRNAPSAPPPAAVRRARSRLTRGVLAGGAVVVLLTLGVWLAMSVGSGSRLPALGNFTQLTNSPGIEWFPSLTPDCQWTVFAGDAKGNRDIYLQSVTGQNAINLTADSPVDDDQPALSPDGTLIAFRSARDGGGIFVMGRTGEALRRVTRDGFNPAWSPDGTRLVYGTWPMELRPGNYEGDTGVRVVNVNGGDPVTVFKGDASLPRFSPNHRRIAFTQRGGGTGQANIMTTAVDGSDAVALTSDKTLNWNPVWAPDGRHVYYVSNRGGSTNVWAIGIDEASGTPRGEPQAVTTPSPFATHLAISGNNQCLAYSAVIETQNIFKLNVNPDTGDIIGDAAPVTTGSRHWSSPDPSPDGEWVVFYSQVQPEGDLYVIKSDGTGLRQLTSGPATDRVPRWSPDGQWIAMFSDRTGRQRVWKIRVDGSGLEEVPTGPWRGGTSAWSPDGARLAVSGDDQTLGGLIVHPHAAGRALEKLPPLPAPEARFVPNSWSRDGRRLAGQVWYGHPGIVVYDLETKRFDTVADVGSWPVWFPDSRRLLFVADGHTFNVVDRQTRKSRKVFSAFRDVLGPPRLSRDGRTIVFSRRTTESDVWTAAFQK